jgi:hypothetical protein
MSQLALSDGQPGNWEEPDFILRRLEIVRFQANGWQEPCESRGSSTELWERGGEIPLRHPTQRFEDLSRTTICCVNFPLF